MRFGRRRLVGNLIDELLELFMEKPLAGGLLIAGVLALYWFILPHLRDRMGGLSQEQYNGLRIIAALVGIAAVVLLRAL